MSLPKALVPWLATVLLVTACGLINPQEKQRKSAVDDFMYALRWQLHQQAAEFFTSEHRTAFLDQMEGLKDLTITDVRLLRIDPAADGRRIETRMEMDYFLLPSATLKTLRINLAWVYFEAGDPAGNNFQIVTPFPPFP